MLNEILVGQVQGTSVAPDRVTFGDYMTRWVASRDGQITPMTADVYDRMVRNYLRPRAIASVRLQALSAIDLDRLYVELERSGGVSGAPLAATTVKQFHAMVHKGLGDAVRKRILPLNVADAADAPKPDRHREYSVWTEEEISRFLAHIKDEPIYPAVHLAAMTGMRRGEILGLRWPDIDFAENRLSVRISLTVVKGQPVFSVAKTQRSVRAIDLDPQTMTVLKAHRKTHNERLLLLGSHFEYPKQVFTDTSGRWIHPNAFTYTFSRLVRQAPVPYIRFHDLRHTHATLMLKSGIPTLVVSERLGHAHPAFTMDRYQHVIPGMQRDAAAQFAERVSSFGSAAETHSSARADDGT